MPQCAKTLKIGSVLLKTGVFKVKNPAQFFKNRKILLFWRNCKKTFKLFVRYLIGSRLLFSRILLLAERLPAFTPWLPIFSLPRRIEGGMGVKNKHTSANYLVCG